MMRAQEGVQRTLAIALGSATHVEEAVLLLNRYYQLISTLTASSLKINLKSMGKQNRFSSYARFTGIFFATRWPAR
jgi:hypothetical protein